MKTYRLDAAESAFFERELDHIKAQTYDIKYPMLKARQFVPVSPSWRPTTGYPRW
jgi:hypothetical protein